MDSNGSSSVAFAGAYVDEEQAEDQGSDCQQGGHEHEVVVSREDAHDDEDQTGGRQDRPERVEGAGRVGRDGIDDRATQVDDHRDDQGLEDERRPPTDRRRDETADQRSRRGANTSHPRDDPEGSRHAT